MNHKQLGDFFESKSQFLSLVLGVVQLKSESTLQMLENSLLKKNEATSQRLWGHIGKNAITPRRAFPKGPELSSVINHNAARPSKQRGFLCSQFASFKNTSSDVAQIFQIKLSPEVEAMRVRDDLHRKP